MKAKPVSGETIVWEESWTKEKEWCAKAVWKVCKKVSASASVQIYWRNSDPAKRLKIRIIVFNTEPKEYDLVDDCYEPLDLSLLVGHATLKVCTEKVVIKTDKKGNPTRVSFYLTVELCLGCEILGFGREECWELYNEKVEIISKSFLTAALQEEPAIVEDLELQRELANAPEFIVIEAD